MNKSNLDSNITTTISSNSGSNNKRKILISIKPKYIDMILKGEKRYEYRRVVPTRSGVTTLIVYISSPIKKVCMEIEVIDVIALPIDELYTLTIDKGGISKKEFYSYFKGKEIGYAYKLGKVKEYNPPKSLLELGIKRAPQSYMYID